MLLHVAQRVSDPRPRATGQGAKWWTAFLFDTIPKNRPTLLSIKSSKHVIVEGLTLLDGPRMMLHVLEDVDVLVQDLRIIINVTGQRHMKHSHNFISPFPINTDGIDISGRDAVVRRIFVINDDDVVAVKPLHAGKPGTAALGLNCTENITISDVRAVRSQHHPACSCRCPTGAARTAWTCGRGCGLIPRPRPRHGSLILVLVYYYVRVAWAWGFPSAASRRTVEAARVCATCTFATPG